MKGRPPCASPPPSSSSSSSEVLRAGELEKRSEGLFQLWKKKQVVLRKESLSLCPSPWSWSEAAGGGGKGGGPPRAAAAKELPFDAILKVDCVERTGKYVYFTLVTTDRREIDFRCPGESCWNASIALALIAHQNQRALRDFKSRHQDGAGEREADEPPAGAPRDRRLARAP